MVIIVSPSLSDHSFVFFTYNNDTGFNDDNSSTTAVYITMVGVLMSLYGISGYEGGATMSEETENAEESAPRGMIEAVFASILTGFIFILALLYAC